MRAALPLALLLAGCPSPPRHLVVAPPAPIRTAVDHPPLAPARPVPVEADLETGEVRIHYRVFGPADAKTTIVVLHGGPGISHQYTLPLEALAGAGTRVVTYDQRGVGRSGSPAAPGDQTFAHHAGDLDKLRIALGAERIDLLGHSCGGLIAMQYAIQHPEHVRSLLFIDSMPPKYNDYNAGQWYYGELMGQLQSEGVIPEALPPIDGDDCSKNLIARLPIYYYDRKHPATANLAGSTCQQAVKTATLEANSYYDFHDALGALAIPTLVVQGEADPFRQQMADGIVAAIPKAELQVLAKCGHLPWEECPAPFFAAVRAFLAQRP